MIEDEDGEGEHLHVLLTDPSLAGEVVTVSVSTRRARSELLVCIKPGEHPFITRESVCLYRFARVREIKAIEQAISSGLARSKEQASEVLVLKLIKGLADSDFAPPGVLAFYRGITQG